MPGKSGLAGEEDGFDGGEDGGVGKEAGVEGEMIVGGATPLISVGVIIIIRLARMVAAISYVGRLACISSLAPLYDRINPTVLVCVDEYAYQPRVLAHHIVGRSAHYYARLAAAYLLDDVALIFVDLLITHRSTVDLRRRSAISEGNERSQDRGTPLILALEDLRRIAETLGSSAQKALVIIGYAQTFGKHFADPAPSRTVLTAYHNHEIAILFLIFFHRNIFETGSEREKKVLSFTKLVKNLLHLQNKTNIPIFNDGIT